MCLCSDLSAWVRSFFCKGARGNGRRCFVLSGLAWTSACWSDSSLTRKRSLKLDGVPQCLADKCTCLLWSATMRLLLGRTYRMCFRCRRKPCQVLRAPRVPLCPTAGLYFTSPPCASGPTTARLSPCTRGTWTSYAASPAQEAGQVSVDQEFTWIWPLASYKLITITNLLLKHPVRGLKRFWRRKTTVCDIKE